MVEYKRASNVDELNQVLELQRQNLTTSLSPREREKEGFVTVSHTLDLLQRMNAVCPHIVAKDKNKVVGYALCMHPKFANEIEVLRSMFHQLGSILPKNITYIVMGQICVEKSYRRKGIFKNMYRFYRAELKNRFALLLTEVATNNVRSVNAHKSIGFRVLKTYVSKGISWKLMQWDWNIG